jgi:transcriptional regulator with XRE-family HTH domain
MNAEPHASSSDLADKIARLVQERGWNQEEFARISNLNRQTIRTILQPNGRRKLRNATIGACARALNLTVHELRDWPLDRLLPRMNKKPPPPEDAHLQRLFDRATQPELIAWLERNPERRRHFTDEEIDELLSLQGTGGPLTAVGVEHYINLIERKRKLKQQVDTIAGTELLDVLEKVVELMYDRVQPYRERSSEG